MKGRQRSIPRVDAEPILDILGGGRVVEKVVLDATVRVGRFQRLSLEHRLRRYVQEKHPATFRDPM